MKKQLISILLAASVISSTITTFAADFTAEMNTVYSNVYLNGSFAEGEYEPGDKLTVIMKKGDAAEDVAYANQAVIESDGAYSVKFHVDGEIDVADYDVLIRAGGTLIDTTLIARTDSVYEAQIKLTDEYGSWLNLLKDDKAVAELKMKNYFDNEVTMKAILSFYDSSDVLCGAYTEPVTFGYEDSTAKTSPIDIPANTSYAKAFLWNSTSSMVSVAAPDVNDSKDYDEDAYLFMFGDSLGHLQGLTQNQQFPSAENGGTAARWAVAREVAAANPDLYQQGWSCYIDDYLNIPYENMYFNCFSGWTMRDLLASSWGFSYYRNIAEMERIKAENPDAKIYVLLNMGTNDGKWEKRDGVERYYVRDEFTNNLRRLYEGYGIIAEETSSYPAATENAKTSNVVDLSDYDESAEGAIAQVKGLKDFGADLILIAPASNVTYEINDWHIKEVGQAMKSVADADTEDGIYVADAYSESYALFYKKLGMQGARDEYFKSVAWYKEFYGEGGEEGINSSGNPTYTIDGTTYTTDYLHYNPKGAAYVANLIIKAVSEGDSNLKYHLNDKLYAE